MFIQNTEITLLLLKTALEYGSDPGLGNTLDLIQAKQDEDGR